MPEISRFFGIVMAMFLQRSPTPSFPCAMGARGLSSQLIN